MKMEEEIYERWTTFINDNKYKQYFISEQEKWYELLNEVIEYINENNKKPSHNDKNEDIRKLSLWIWTQQTNYNRNEHIMKDPKIYERWTIFINDDKYKQYFISNEEKWHELLNEVIHYINENNKRPSSSTNNDRKIKQLGMWIVTQQKNYKKKEHIMKEQKIYERWTIFINDDKYKQYF
jgi:hypothetical protein